MSRKQMLKKIYINFFSVLYVRNIRRFTFHILTIKKNTQNNEFCSTQKKHILKHEIVFNKMMLLMALLCIGVRETLNLIKYGQRLA